MSWGTFSKRLSQQDILGFLDVGDSTLRGQTPLCKHLSTSVSVSFDDVLSVKANYVAKSNISRKGGYARAWILGDHWQHAVYPSVTGCFEASIYFSPHFIDEETNKICYLRSHSCLARVG